jgi:hypothetical protein
VPISPGLEVFLKPLKLGGGFTDTLFRWQTVQGEVKRREQAWVTHNDYVLPRQLLDNAEILTKELWAVGIKNVYLDGSFVEDKDRPNDIDGYFETGLTLTGPDLHKFAAVVQLLNLKNKHKIWNWNPNSRVSVAGFAKKQLPMWAHYRVELYPHLQQSTGIKDAQGNDLMFPSAFRQCRASGIPKGIIKVIKGGKK